MFLFKKNKIEKSLKAYANGKLINISEVNDEVFSKKMMGDGVAIIPSEGKVYSPCDGVVTVVFEPTEHAIGITMENGMEILLHCGLDTVNMTEKVFTSHVKTNDVVKTGDLLIEYNKKILDDKNIDDTCMCIILKEGKANNIQIMQPQQVVANETEVIKYK